MSLNTFSSGVNTSFSSELNNNFKIGWSVMLQSFINQLEDRTITFSADGGLFAEAYTDSNGRLNSVDTTNTVAFYNSTDSTYVPYLTDEASGDTTDDPDSFTNPSFAFDNDKTTAAVKSTTSSTEFGIGKTFSSKQPDSVYVKWAFAANAGTSRSGSTVKIQSYNGSTWDDEVTLYTAGTVNSFNASGEYLFYPASPIQGVRLAFKHNSSPSISGSGRAFSIEYGDVADGIIVHDIPTGTFSDTFTKGFLTAKLVNYEAGANVQYKLTNASEDTGYSDYNTVLSNSTAFTSEPTKLWVKLIPKSTSPTNGYPSISGVAIMGDI